MCSYLDSRNTQRQIGSSRLSSTPRVHAQSASSSAYHHPRAVSMPTECSVRAYHSSQRRTPSSWRKCKGSEKHARREDRHCDHAKKRFSKEENFSLRHLRDKDRSETSSRRSQIHVVRLCFLDNGYNMLDGYSWGKQSKSLVSSGRKGKMCAGRGRWPRMIGRLSA